MANAMKHLPALLIGFVLETGITYGMFVAAIHRPKPTPVLDPPTAIKVTLHPWGGVGGIDGEPVDIPPDKLDIAFRLLTPETFFEGGIHDFITPIVAEAVITHADGKETSILVRDHGKNPAVVTVDGRNYFYARNDSDVHAGAAQIIRLVREVANKKK
jgi:hypothetical protein